MESSELGLQRRQSRDGLEREEGRPPPRGPPNRGGWGHQSWHGECGRIAEGCVAGGYSLEQTLCIQIGKEKYGDIHANLK